MLIKIYEIGPTGRPRKIYQICKMGLYFELSEIKMEEKPSFYPPCKPYWFEVDISILD